MKLLVSVMLLGLLSALQMLHASSTSSKRGNKRKNRHSVNHASIPTNNIEQTQPDGRQYRHLGPFSNGFDALLISDPKIEKVFILYARVL